MPFPSQLAAQTRVPLHRGPKKGRLPILTLPAFPAQLIARATLLLGPTSERRTQAFLRVRSPGCWDLVVTRDDAKVWPLPRSALVTLDTGRSGDVSRGRAAFGNFRHSGSFEAAAQEYSSGTTRLNRFARLPCFPETQNGRIAGCCWSFGPASFASGDSTRVI